MEMVARFRDWTEARANGYLRRNDVRHLVIGHRCRPNGKVVPVTLNDIGVNVRMITHHVSGANYSVDGWEVVLENVRVRAASVYLTNVENQIGGLGAVAEMFRLEDLDPIVHVARALASEKYWEAFEG